MNIVYVLISKKFPDRCYIGLTNDLERRIKEHNNGDSVYSKRYMPCNYRSILLLKIKFARNSLKNILSQVRDFHF